MITIVKKFYLLLLLLDQVTLYSHFWGVDCANDLTFHEHTSPFGEFAECDLQTLPERVREI